MSLDFCDSRPDNRQPSRSAHPAKTSERAARSEVHLNIRVARAYAEADIAACVFPGVAAITYPGAESRLELEQVETLIGRQERLRGIRPGVIALEATIRTPAGIGQASDLAAGTPRLQALAVERRWLAVHLGVEDADGSAAMTYALGECELSARENDLALGHRGSWEAAGSIPVKITGKRALSPARRRIGRSSRRLLHVTAGGRGHAIIPDGAKVTAEREAP